MNATLTLCDSKAHLPAVLPEVNDPKFRCNYLAAKAGRVKESMYESYWGFKEAPFSQTPDSHYYFLSQTHEESLMLMHYGLTRNKGASLLVGGLGSGKTSLCHRLLDLLRKDHMTVSIVNPILTPLQLHMELLASLGLSVRSRDRQAVARGLHNALLDLHKKGQKVVVVIDDAHRIESDGTFDEVRMLLNFQTDDQFLVNFALVGQPQLARNLTKFPELDQVFAIRERLEPLSLSEIGHMIVFRLHAAGYDGDQNLFDSDAILELHRCSKGVPRIVCHLADNALMLGKLRKASHIDGALMYQSIQEFYGADEEAA